MLLIAKIIGGLCTVAIPMGVCGVQAFLTKTQQEHQKQEIESELQKTQETLVEAYKNYESEINRIKDEKNALATTKKDLTYNPVNIKDNIAALNASKTNYEKNHTSTQESITQLITEHETKLKASQSTIESLWTVESARVKAIQSNLESAINDAKQKNTSLTDSINTLKVQIDTTINEVFNPGS